MKRGPLQLYDFQNAGVEAILQGLLHATYMDSFGNIRRGRAFLLHDEMGLGKTIQTWEALRRLRNQCQLAYAPTLVVGPASALDSVWMEGDRSNFEEFRVHSGICNPSKMNDADVVVISYSTLLSAYKYYIFHQMTHGRLSNDELIRFCVINNQNIESTQGMQGDDLRRALFNIARGIPRALANNYRPGIVEFMQQKWGCMIMDEVHHIKNAASASTKAVGFVSTHFRIGLSGTPIMNSGNDLLNILKFGLGLVDLDWVAIKTNPNGHYSHSITNTFMLGREKHNLPEMAPILAKRHCASEVVVLPWIDLNQKYLYVKAKESSLDTLAAMDELGNQAGDTKVRRKELSQTFMARLQRMRQICLHKDLPNYMQGEPIPQQRMQWAPETHCAFGPWMRSRASILFRILRLRSPLHHDLCLRVVSTFCREERHLIEPSTKMLQVLPFIHDKFIVFCTFRVFLESIMKPWLDQIGVRSTIFSGGSKKRQRDALRDFNEDPDMKGMLIVKTAGAEGLNLQHATGTCIIMDPHFNIALDEQAAQRIDRIGQTRDVVVRRLFMKGSIDEAIRIMQEQKTTNVNAWLRNKKAGRTLEIQKQFLRTFDTV